MSQNFLTGSRCALDQNGDIGRTNLLEAMTDALHFGGATKDHVVRRQRLWPLAKSCAICSIA